MVHAMRLERPTPEPIVLMDHDGWGAALLASSMAAATVFLTLLTRFR
jgi:hypothetical protein